MKFALPDFSAAKAWFPERPARFLRHYFKEIAIALALAIVAAIIIDPLWAKHEGQLKQQMIENDLKAVATLEVFDSHNKPIGLPLGAHLSPRTGDGGSIGGDCSTEATGRSGDAISVEAVDRLTAEADATEGKKQTAAVAHR